jgi:hypothetical protein
MQDCWKGDFTLNVIEVILAIILLLLIFMMRERKKKIIALVVLGIIIYDKIFR